MSRYLNVLDTPVEVRNALRENKLKLAVAEKISSLDKATQAELARRFRDGEHAVSVVAEMVDSPERLATIDAVLDRLSRVTGQASEALDACKNQVQKETNSQLPLRDVREHPVDPGAEAER